MPRVEVDEAPHGATPQQLLAIITRLMAGSAARTTTLDILTNALKAAGFTRPPGSPRLVTRLKQVHEVEVLPGGQIRMRDGAQAPAQVEAPVAEVASRPRRRRRGRRGGAGRPTEDVGS
jgi:hypothetical protein